MILKKQNEIGVANIGLEISFIVELDNKFPEVVYPYSASQPVSIAMPPSSGHSDIWTCAKQV